MCGRAGEEECRREHTYIHANIHKQICTYIHIYLHTCIPPYIHTYIHSEIHINAYLPTYIYKYIHRYRHTHAYIQLAKTDSDPPSTNSSISNPSHTSMFSPPSPFPTNTYPQCLCPFPYHTPSLIAYPCQQLQGRSLPFGNVWGKPLP